jgi:preprotein translocase SecE subunit
MKKLFKRVASTIINFFAKITRPVRKTRMWKWLRKHILKSPFKGYFVSSWKELKHVTWPDRKKATRLTLTVIAFALVFAIFTAVLDLGFERLAREIFLN